MTSLKELYSKDEGTLSENIEEDLYLSDVHVDNLPIVLKGQKSISNFEFKIPDLTSFITKDEDGDYAIQKPKKYKICIEHSRETTLKDVGFQLWRGAFYLCDFLIHNANILQDKIVVDLGAGMGITSFISSLFCQKVYATDLESIIELAEKNYEKNKLLLNLIEKETNKSNSACKDNMISFKNLDWSKYEDFNFEKGKLDGSMPKYEFNQDELMHLQKAQVFLATDVVYDHTLTINFLNMLVRLMKSAENQPKEAYVALEKRINFDTETMSVSSSAYSYFETSMHELNEYEEENIRFETELLSGDFPQYFIDYNRNSYLFVWKIKTSII